MGVWSALIAWLTSTAVQTAVLDLESRLKADLLRDLTQALQPLLQSAKDEVAAQLRAEWAAIQATSLSAGSPLPVAAASAPSSSSSSTPSFVSSAIPVSGVDHAARPLGPT